MHKFLVFLSVWGCSQVWANDYLRIITLDRLNLKQEAIQAATSLQQPDVDVLVTLARLYLERNQLSDAQAILSGIIQTNPNDSDIYVLQISLFEKQKEYEKALIWTDMALLFFPFNTELYPKKWRLDAMLNQIKIPFKEGADTSITIAKQQTTPVPVITKTTPPQPPTDSKAYIKWAISYLKQNPKDGDVALKLAQIYMKQEQYAKVPKLLLPYIAMYPKYIDLYLFAINAYIQMKDYQKALGLLKKGLQVAPKNLQLQKKLADVNSLLHPEKKPQAQQKPEYLNELGVFDQLYYITDRKQVWDYTTAFYGRQTKFGKLYGKVNYANRLNREAVQFEGEFFPRLGKYIYLDLDATVANQPILFPRYSYSGEGYVVLPGLFDVSGGAQLNRIIGQLKYSRFTFSVSKEVIQNLAITFRPYFYAPVSGQNSTFYTVNIRKMLQDPYTYLGVVLGSGTTPDLANLETVDFLVLRNKIMVAPYLNLALFNEQIILNFSLLYQHQLFPNQRVREWKGGTMGATWRF